ncbi:MAG: transglutaminase family protein [Limimaricola soesokkakensis]|uniref:transglutaminase family protein n=1 Tax=Limimaricola soesokkakensis TaxID=1343159 RepID=UPI004057F7A9
MRLSISHRTTYSFDAPVDYALQQLRLTPKPGGAQRVLRWSNTVTGGQTELSFEDQHANKVELVSVTPGAREISVLSEGELEIEDRAGVHGPHAGYMPLWLFERSTPLTRPGARCRKLVSGLRAGNAPLERLHTLSSAVAEAVQYQTGSSNVATTAEDALEAGAGVCQDHAHVFITCARLMAIPARYVSGYLMMEGQVSQEATHAWAEAHVPDLGWVGFDVSNAISPDARYVRVATGLDYTEAAPVNGFRFGTAREELSVAIEVRQAETDSQ